MPEPRAPLEREWLGDSKKIIRRFPADVREDLGGDLRRLQKGERALDSGPMAPALPGVFELRAEDKDLWYRVFYHMREGIIYVLHCFTKKTNTTSQGDVEIGRKRMSELKQRLAKAGKR